jgi:hypothetical protein
VPVSRRIHTRDAHHVARHERLGHIPFPPGGSADPSHGNGGDRG